MALALKLEVKESIPYLRTLMRKSISMISVRINMLVQLKKGKGHISRRKLSVKLGVGSSSIQRWKKSYLEGGLEALLQHGRKGSVSKIFGSEEHKFLEELLSNPENGVQGYRELQKIISDHFGREFVYVTLVEYCKRNFETKIKVARKNHVKKNEEVMSEFKKKTLTASSKKSPKR